MYSINREAGPSPDPADDFTMIGRFHLRLLGGTGCPEAYDLPAYLYLHAPAEGPYGIEGVASTIRSSNGEWKSSSCKPEFFCGLFDKLWKNSWVSCSAP